MEKRQLGHFYNEHTMDLMYILSYLNTAMKRYYNFQKHLVHELIDTSYI